MPGTVAESKWTFQAPPEFNDEQFARWQSLLESRTGIDFCRHKQILHSGLVQRMREIGIDDFEAYYRRIIVEPDGNIEWTRLVDRLSVKETRFFREPDACQQVYAQLLAGLARQPDAQPKSLDVWSVGCATGQEAYSLAMLASEAINHAQVDCFLGVLATDISNTALAIARRGCYTHRQLAQLDPVYKRQYFAPSADNSFQVNNSLRQKVCFAQGNLLQLATMPLQAMDVIYCQNVLIYFQRERQIAVLDELVKHLKPAGMLVIGSAEASTWRHPLMGRCGGNTTQAYIKQKVGNYE